MGLVNDGPTVIADSYREVLSRAGLEDAFEAAWSVPLDTPRDEADLGSVGEDKLIEKAVEHADRDWAFSMANQPPHYHLTPVTVGEAPCEN